MTDYECSQKYWDSVAANEEVAKAGISEKYTQAQCLTAFRLGLRHVKRHTERKELVMLKTDLWTEGIVRSREVLNHAVELAERKGYTVRAWGIDISGITCSLAAVNGTKAKIKQGDIRALNFPWRSLDMVLDMSTTDHIQWSEAKTALDGYGHCLKSGGVLVLMFAHDRKAIDRDDHRVDYFPFSVKEVREEVKKWADIKGEYAVHFLNIPPAGAILDMGKKVGMGRAVAKVFEVFEFTPLSKMASGIAPLYTMIARKR